MPPVIRAEAGGSEHSPRTTTGRRALLTGGSSAAVAAAAAAMSVSSAPAALADAGIVDLPALRGLGYGKATTIYPDYVQLESGVQYKDLRVGDADEVTKVGDKLVVDWDAYTIGYYGRIIQAKNLAKGGDFEGGEDFLRFTLGSPDLIPGFQEPLVGMRVGGIRRFVVPPGPLNYPSDGFKRVGPTPSTFSGKRTLDFVMVNTGAIDKTMLFDVEILGVGDKARAKRAPGTWVVDLPTKK